VCGLPVLTWLLEQALASVRVPLHLPPFHSRPFFVPRTFALLRGAFVLRVSWSYSFGFLLIMTYWWCQVLDMRLAQA
jgi:hypothetical protein